MFLPWQRMCFSSRAFLLGFLLRSAAEAFRGAVEHVPGDLPDAFFAGAGALGGLKELNNLAAKRGRLGIEGGEGAGRLGEARGQFRRQSGVAWLDRKSTRLNSSHLVISYAVFCL